MPSRTYDHSVRTSGPRDALNDEVIRGLSAEEVIRIWRFSPSHNFVEGDPTTLHFLDQIARYRSYHSVEWANASKEVGGW